MVLVTVGGREKHKIEKEEKKTHRNTKGKKYWQYMLVLFSTQLFVR